jgi:hypothetical protein
MRMLGGVRFALVTVALLALGSVAGFCSIASAQGSSQASLFGAFSTVGTPLLESDFHPLAAMDRGGQATLVWHSSAGPVLGVDSATIAPGHAIADRW